MLCKLVLLRFGKTSISRFRSKINRQNGKEVIFVYKKYEALLLKCNKSSYRVAKETGIAQSVLSDWKTGRSNPKLDKLQKIADYFGVPVTYFLEE